MLPVIRIGVCLVLLSALPYLLASSGDRSPVYQNCVKNCFNSNCTNDGSDFKDPEMVYQEIWDTMLLWSCQDECRYHCMWRTVEKFRQRGFNTPKFHGKWPFHRFLGIQEPAATFASILNFASNYHMFKQLRRHWYGKDVPTVMFWHVFSLLCMNTWVWSAVFHTRDTPLTEFLDYAGAMLLVLAFLVAGLVRILYKWRIISGVLCAMVLFFYIEHCRYLYAGQVDYEYNMTANVFFGIIGSGMWAMWAFIEFLLGRRHAARMVAFTTLSGAALALELYDFPPLPGGWDAHALWHLATSPMPIILCKFVMLDLEFLQKQQRPAQKLA